MRFYEGTWQDYLSDLESEKEEAGVWDVVYFGESRVLSSILDKFLSERDTVD